MIELKNMSCIFENGRGISNVNLHVHKGETIALIGPSGSGKSTLLRCINGLQEITDGDIEVMGKNLMDPSTDIYEIRKDVGMVFQHSTLFTHKTLLENAMMAPMDLLGKSRTEAFMQGKKYLTQVGLGERLSAYPDELSGGQRQRGEIARCLAMDPDVLLLDEPTSALDVINAGEVMAVVSRLSAEGRTMLITTHDFTFCKNAADRIIYMEDGKIVEEGTPEEIFEHPKTKQAKAFVKKLRTFTYEITSKRFDLYELNGLLEGFARDYFLSKKNTNALELLVEELIVNNLLSYTSHIELNISYSEADEHLDVEIYYEGDPFDPFNNPDEDVLSMLLVRQMTSNITYRYTSHNELSFVMKLNNL